MRPMLSAIALLSMLTVAVSDQAAERGPSLDLRPSPRLVRYSGEVLLTAQLAGGSDVEELHCPRVVWSFGDGSVSAQQSDCEPWSAGTRIERFFQARHLYVVPGEYAVREALWNGEMKLKEAHALYV